MEQTNLGEIITLSIFIATFILILSNKFERTTAALMGLFIMLTIGYIFKFMTLEDVLVHVDWETIILLFGMMTYVGLMAKTGFFKYLGVKTVKFSRGNPWLMFFYLSMITTFVSMVMDNVTTILIMIPLTVEISEMLKINPVPLIVGEAVLSNIGGVGTMIGDPPNIMIGISSGLTFNEFILHLFPPVFVCLIAALFIARVVYKRWLKKEPKNIKKLMALNPDKYIENEKRMKIFLYILIGMIILFTTESITGIPPAFIALIGGTLALVISLEDPKEAFKAVEWPTLVFFIALFALVGGMIETGLLDEFSSYLTSISENVLILALILLWASGFTASFVDHIPITAALIPVVTILTAHYNTDIFWWALAMGVGIGGNITPLGSSAGVITLSLSTRFGYIISNKDWFKLGTLVGIAGLGICSLFVYIIYII